MKMKLPELKGTKEQVKWAEDIRRGFIENVQRRLGNSSWRRDHLKAAGMKDHAIERFQESLRETDASKWIINREILPLFALYITNGWNGMSTKEG